MPGGRRLAVSLALAGGAVAVAGLAFGALGYVAAAAASLLFVAWRHDTATGACLPLALLLLIALAVMTALIGLMAITAPR